MRNIPDGCRFIFQQERSQMMSDPRDDKAANEPMPAPTWKPSPPELDLEPDRLGESGTEDADEPPVRSGKSGKPEKLTEGAGDDNPVHHTGRVPPKVTKDQI
jgi:hypothetical protein